MAWTHDEESNTLRCVSVKHDRDLTIQLPRSGDQAVYCRECWRNCMFWILPPEELPAGVIPRFMHFFNPAKPQ